jgi:hypothetical protein
MKALFPLIDYSYWLNKNNWESRSSIQTMISNLRNRNLINNKITVDNVKDKIKNEIKKYINTKKYENLLNAFTYIQVWGGSSARFYTPSIINDFQQHQNKYKSAVNKILKDEISEAYIYLNKEGKIKGLGLSFIPKHICFWSGKGNRIEGAPMLDSVISKILYNENVSKIDYDLFIADCNEFSKSINMKPAEIEIALFSFAKNYWRTSKTRSTQFRNKIEDKKDQNIAMLLINK